MNKRLVSANNAYYKYCTLMLRHGDAIDYMNEWQELAACLTKAELELHERFCRYTHKKHVGDAV